MSSFSFGEAGSISENKRSVVSADRLQYDGSKDDLDWSIDFKYFNLI